MAQNATLRLNYTIGGTAFASNEVRTAEGAITHVIDLPAGSAGLMDSTTGVDGLVTGHGIVATDIIDLHYDDPTTGLHKVRRGLTIDTDAANAVTFDETPAGEGDALPADGVAVVISVQVVVNTDFAGDDVEIVATKSDVKAMVDIRTSSASKQAQKLATGASWFWMKSFGFTNPLAASAIDEANVSNGSTDVGVVFLAILYQSVP